MKSSMHLICVFIVLLIKQLAVCEGCDIGWFGQSCNYSCQCRKSKSCTIDGDCPVNDTCATYKFGPACQFKDVSKYHGRPKSVLWDGKDETCNPNVKATSASITLVNMFPLSWFRMVVMGNSYDMLDFTTTVNNDSECLDEQRFVVNRSTVDVTCSGRLYLTRLTIKGTIVGSMCSLLISGGRTISLKQRTWQSSNLCSNLSECGSQNGVDSRRATNSANFNCTSTAIQSDRPEWRLYFSVPFFVTSLQVYTKIAVYRRIVNFDARLYTALENKTNHFSKEISASYVIHKSVTEQVPISFMSIQQAYQPVPTDRILVICEAFVVGDSICPDGTYGFECWQCQCSASQVCNTYTGICSIECSKNCLGGVCDLLTGQCFNCEAGYFGEYCENECSVQFHGENCNGSICAKDTGECLQCEENYSGRMCQECSVGVHGENCTNKCPKNCNDSICVKDTGECLQCEENYSGRLCLECSLGFYGEYCAQLCSDTCRNNICDRKSGYCFDCVAHFEMPSCTDCIASYYGETCELKCSRFCVKKKCDRLSGDCLECIGNRIGAKCEDCAGNFFGLQCDLPCGKFCFNYTCDAMTGKCDACKKGYQGEVCSTVAGKPELWIAGLSLLPLGLLIFFLMPTSRDGSDEDTDTTSSLSFIQLK